MNRKVIALNVALLFLVALAGGQLRKQWESERQREAATTPFGPSCAWEAAR